MPASGRCSPAVQDSTFDDDVRLSGGPGTDDLEDAGGNTFNGALEVENFEG